MGNAEGNRTTVSDLLVAAGSDVERLIDALAARSSIEHWNPRGSGFAYFGATGSWNDLDDEGRQLQSQALEEYRQLAVTMRVLLRAQPPDAIKEFKEEEEAVIEFLERQQTYSRTVDDARSKAVVALQSQLDRLGHLYDRGDGSDVYVPDTNALIFNPALEEWFFADSPRFELVLAPSVMKELDELKINHRNEDVREKALGLIRRIKGYRARGSLAAGVPLVSGVSTNRSIAIEPALDESLPWLDPDNLDDRFLASALEVIRQHPRSAVTIVTGDINLQNKAEFARLPFVEPPEAGT